MSPLEHLKLMTMGSSAQFKVRLLMASHHLRLDWHTDPAQPDCLTRNNYNEAKCQDAVKALYECCEAFYQRYGDEATSPSCPQPNLLRLKIKQQKEGK